MSKSVWQMHKSYFKCVACLHVLQKMYKIFNASKAYFDLILSKVYRIFQNKASLGVIIF